MALIPCPECKERISTTADSCPKCGHQRSRKCAYCKTGNTTVVCPPSFFDPTIGVKCNACKKFYVVFPPK